MQWLDNKTIMIDPPKRPKKLTGTRFATILGLNPWSTDFEVWCEITRTYQKPFEDTIYTLAGKAIEPKQAEYMKKSMFMTNLITPTDIYGADYFNRTRGDFFYDKEVFGGMWDYLLFDENAKPMTVLEMKTTKRAEDWEEDIPEYYALQAALYAYLLDIDEVIMVCSFLSAKDYEKPDEFIPSINNTITRQFKLSERYPDFDKYIKRALKWWDKYVVQGISPEYNEKKDADILKELRTNTLNPETDIKALIKEGEDLKSKIDALTEPIQALEKRLKVINDIIKKHAIGEFRDNDKKVTMLGDKFEWSVTKTESVDIDKEALKADGLYDKYASTKTSYRISTKPVENK